MNIGLTYQSIHDWRDDVQRTSLFARFGAFLTFRWLDNWFASKASKQIREIHQTLSAVYAQILADDKVLNGVTQLELDEFSKVVTLLTKLHSTYQRANFFGDQGLGQLFEDTLQLSYSIESEIRVKAFKGKKRVTTDDGYKEALSATSQNAMYGKL